MEMIAKPLPTISEKEFKTVKKWFEDAVAIVSENLSKTGGKKSDTAVLESVVRTSGNSIAATVRYETFWKAGPNMGKLYAIQSATYHVQNYIAGSDDGDGTLRVSGATFSESNYNGFRSTHTSSGHCSMFGGTLDSNGLERLRSKKAEGL